MSWRLKSDGTTVVVSGDLKTDAEFMVPFASGADLLVHEAYTEEGLDESLSRLPTEHHREQGRLKFRPTHSEVSVVAQIAEIAGVRRLALTHLMPNENEEQLVSIASQHFGGDVFVAQPEGSVELE